MTILPGSCFLTFSLSVCLFLGELMCLLAKKEKKKKSLWENRIIVRVYFGAIFFFKFMHGFS